MDTVNKIECPDCMGEGEYEHPHLEGAYGGSHAINPPDPVMIECEACHGKGWREMTDDERDTASENAFSDMCEGEPPLSFAEQSAAQAKREAQWGVR